MFNTGEQSISQGNGNIQAQGNVDNSRNYFIDYKPEYITFYEQDIFRLIEEFDNNLDLFDEQDNNTDDKEFDVVDKITKNRLNNLSEEYFNEISEEFLPFFYKIDTFLRAPQNKKVLTMYRKIAYQLKASITANRKKFLYFEEILDDIVETIVQAVKEGNENIDISLVVVFLNYMYWNCDIGRRK